jgi:hypothetical protein
MRVSTGWPEEMTRVEVRDVEASLTHAAVLAYAAPVLMQPSPFSTM